MARGVLWNEPWLPDAVRSGLVVDPPTADVESWLGDLRQTVEEYEDWSEPSCKPGLGASLVSLQSFDSSTWDHFSLNKYFSADEDVCEEKIQNKERSANAFDDILSTLGNEIYELESYQNRHAPRNRLSSDLGRSIMHLFDQCMDELKTETMEQVKKVPSVDSVSMLSDEVFLKSDPKVVYRPNVNHRSKKHSSCDVNYIFDKGVGVPVPPKRKNRHSNPTQNENIDVCKPRPVSKMERLQIETDRSPDAIKTLSGRTVNVYSAHKSDTDSGNNSPSSDYADYQNLWHCTSGSRRPVIGGNAKILQEHRGVISTISYDSVRDLSNSTLDISKQRIIVCGRPASKSSNSSSSSVGCRSEKAEGRALRVPVDEVPWLGRSGDERSGSGDMVHCTSECDLTDECHRSLGGSGKKSNSFVYSKMSENLYENVGVLRRQNAESRPKSNYSRASSVVDDASSVELISDSDSWRTPFGGTSTSTEYASESPIYENLQNFRIKSVPADVTAWKAMLLDPYWNDDEEDEWVSAEEAADYAVDHKPPFVIPRIKPFRQKSINVDHQNAVEEPKSPSIKEITKRYEEGFNKAPSESPKINRSPLKVGGSNEALTTKLFSQRNEMSPILFRKNLEAISRSGKSKSMVTTDRRDQPKNIQVAVKVLPALYDPAMCSQYEGNVHRAKLTTNGKKVRKNWQNSYAVLTETCLVFYKDKKMYELTKDKDKASTVTTEAIVPLNGALISVSTPQQTSRAHALVIASSSHDQYLIHHDQPEKIQMWHTSIVKAINKLPSDYVCPNKIVITNPSAGTPSPTNKHHNRTKLPTKVVEGSMEDLTDLSEHVKIKSKLKKFFIRRPTMESLIKNGIYKDEPVFGRNLEQVCPDVSPRVPEFVVRCVKAIEFSSENMTADGLYRASGNLSQVQKLRLEADQNNFSALDKEVDVHVLTGALKLFFRELKEPLVPFKFFQKCLDASNNRVQESRIKEFKEIIDGFPECNKHTLKYILEHLLRVTNYKEKNRMHIANIAIVLGPTLLWAPPECSQNMAIDCLQQNSVIEIFMTDFDRIFKDDGKRK